MTGLKVDAPVGTDDSCELPEGWVNARFMEIFDIQGGTQPPKSEFVYKPTEGYIRLLQIRDFGDKPVPTFVRQKPGLKTCTIEDVLIGRYGASVGRICTGMEGAYNVALAKVVIPKEVDHQFVFHLLNSYAFQSPLLEIERSAQDGFNKEDLAAIYLPIPPLDEQRRIVAKLEELLGRVSRAKARLDRIPALLKRFRQSVLSAACSGKLTADWRDGDVVNDELPETWKSVVFDSVMQCKPQNGLYKPQSSYGSGTRIVRIDAFYDGAIAPWKDLKRLELTPDEIALYGLSNGDLLINRVNSMKFLGKSALVRELSEPCVFESNMMRVRLKLEVVDPEYAVLYLQSWTGIQELRKNAKHAVNQSSINQDDVRSVDFNLPPLTEQKEIVRRVEQFFAFADQIEARLTKAQAQVDRLTQSILAKAFRGELVPTEAELARREGRDYEPASKLLERIRSSKDVEIGTGKKKRNRPTTRRKVSP